MAAAPTSPSLDDTLPIDIVRILLEKGANPNLQLKLLPPYRATGADRGLDGMLTVGTTPLLRAAKAQDADSIKLLLEHGAIVDLPNSQGMTPTVAASGMGSVDADTRGNYSTADIQERSIASLDLLLAHGGELNGRAGRLQQSPFTEPLSGAGTKWSSTSWPKGPTSTPPIRAVHRSRLRDGPRRRQQPRRPAHRRS